MASSYVFRMASRSGIPLAAAYWSSQTAPPSHSQTTHCGPTESSPDPRTTADASHQQQQTAGMRPDATGDFHGIFPNRQLWHPKIPYPLWDSNWDNLEPPTTGDPEQDRQNMRRIRKEGVTRHIILIRHGQYDETYKEDEKRILTELGKEQAELTGQRLAEMLKGATENGYGPCHINAVRVSGLARAQETAEIIAKHLPTVPYVEPDPLLNEGRPSHHLPSGKVSHRIIEATDHGHERIERAYQKYFSRAPAPAVKAEQANPQEAAVSAAHGTDAGNDPDAREDHVEEEEPLHQFEVIVCHANVIRYFLCRALQMPPEAWLRYCPFNCSLTYLTIRPTGTVSCRMVGDIGHLPYDKSTFSQHKGYNW